MPNTRKLTRRGGRSRSGPRRTFSQPPQRAPANYAPSNVVSQPNFYPRTTITRTVQEPYNITTDGISPDLIGINFSLADVPGATELAALYQTYCIEQVELWFRPEYTVLSDASALSNSVNVDLYSAIDLTNSSAPASVAAVCEYQNCAHTSIVRTHYRKIRPAYLIDALLPSCAMMSTASLSSDWMGLKVAIPPTGIAMTFRTIAKFKISFAGLK